MTGGPFRYVSDDEDSGRWLGFPFRVGDIVISTRSKSGTTWMQMICALLVVQQPELPAPLWQMSPWLDWLGVSIDQVRSQLAAQQHRRFVKTHTPLDGIPIDPRATYIVVGRHPLDMATSLYHQGDNLDRERMSELTGQPLAPDRPRPSLHDWLLDWIDWDGDPRSALDSLPGVMWHLSDAWARRDEANIVLIHYDDLSRDLPGQMRGLAEQLDIVVPEHKWPALVEAASFATMRARADELAPNPNGVLKSNAQFFRRGSSGGGRDVLSTGEVERYLARAGQLASPDMLAWLHRR
jgi:aryl sulfotransferase